jgi:acyl-CoA dehydrogenase
MMRVDLDPAVLIESREQGELRGALREFFAEGSVSEEVLWRRLAGELGVHGLAIPESYGGTGYGFGELAVVLEEAGRALRGARLLPTVVMAGHALLYSGDAEACASYLPLIADGTLTATVAGFEDEPAITAERGSAGWTLQGAVDFALDGQEAGLVVVRAGTSDGERLFACEPAAGTCVRTPRRVLDETLPQARLEFHGAPAEPVGEADRVAEVVERTLDTGRAALAAVQVGGSDHALAATVSYVGQRKQFGRPVGSFQAVKHRLADLLVEVEAARSAAAYATACVAGGSAELPIAASAAALVCSGAFQLATAEYVQLHGGIGFTWEHPAHLYVRRARTAQVMFGGADFHRARLAKLLGL